MISVDVIKKVKCPVSSKKIKDTVVETFVKNGLVSDTTTSVTFVSSEEMKSLAEKYMDEHGKEAEGHPVLSFVNSEIEGVFPFPPDNIIHIGEIVISWDWVKNESRRLNKLTDDVACLLVEHGALHLMGIHHD